MNVVPLQSTYAKALADQLFAPTSAELARWIPDAGESLLAAAVELSKFPQPDACERFIAKLNGAVQLASKLRAALLRESAPVPPEAA